MSNEDGNAGASSGSATGGNSRGALSGAGRNPPRLLECTDYGNWRKKIEMWSIVTGYEKQQHAVVVMLSCFEGNSKAERTLADLKIEDLHKDNGLKTLLDKLDKVYKKDKIDEAYTSYKKFIQWKRPDEMAMQDFVVEFEHRYQQMSAHDMILPDSVKAFILLDASNIHDSGRQMAFTVASDLKYDTMKSALKRIFSDESCSTRAIATDAEAWYSTKRPGYRKQRVFRQEDSAMSFNPRNKQGELTRCVVCDSKMHWANRCPHNPRRKAVNLTEYQSNESGCTSGDENIPDPVECIKATFLTQSDENEIYTAEATGCAVLDTACTKTVCGEKWLSSYVGSLDEESRRNMQIMKGGTSFKFGDGRKVASIKSVKLPANIAGMPCFIETEVVRDNLPLLLSKSTLKKTKTTLNLENDQATMMDKPIELMLTTNGHYCVNIHPHNTSDYSPVRKESVFISDSNNGVKIDHKNILKLHKQFGHASVENIIRLLSNSGNTIGQAERMMIQQVIRECQVCKIHKKPPPRPAVGLPRSQGVNDTVALDLHQLMPNLWFLHIIDEFSRFSRAAIIRSKQSSVIAQKFMQLWVSVIGAPKKVISDNGKEFDNAEFRDMCENFNIKVMTTPSYSAWCNGICERHNYILSDILTKVRKDINCDWETGLAWALSAKNSLINHNGFSPNQIVFGRQSNLPSIASDELPALSGKTLSEKVADNISALYSARRAFTTADSSERIRKALRCKTRPFGGAYQIGDDVYFKRNDAKEWKGPARVLGQDGVVVFLRHGAQLYRAHASRVQKAHEQPVLQDEDITNSDDLWVEAKTGTSENHLPEVVHEPQISNNESHSDTQPSDSHSTPRICLRKAQVVRFQKNGIQYEAEIMSRAGKSTGKYPNAFNVRYISPSDMPEEWINFDFVQNLSVVLPETQDSGVKDQIHIAENVDFLDAKHKELQNWIDNDVFEEQDNHGQKCVSVRWVCTLKQTNEGIKPKARLVARGFEDPDLKMVEKDSPTCCKSVLRSVISITLQKRWKLNSLDIKTAFLQGEELGRDVFLTPPKEANTASGKVWKLKKCVYGLSDASLQWYERVKRFMLESGGNMAKSDPSLFYWHNDACELQGLIAIHVDDFLWAGNRSFQNSILPKLRDTFKIGNEESGQFKYLGLQMSQDKSGMIMDQNDYIKSLEPLQIEPHRKIDESLTINEQDSLRARIGQLLWISTQTRPDISFDVCVLSTNFRNALVQDVHRANKVLRKLKSDSVGLKFRQLGADKNLKIICYTDASFANLNNGGSQAGNLVFLVGENGLCNLLSWESKRIKRVVKSSLAAETLALSEGIDNAIYMASVCSELCNGKAAEDKIPVEIVTDNLSLYNAIKSHKQVTEKRLRVELAAVKEMIDNKEISCIRWMEGKYQLADKLTKAGTSSNNLLSILRDGQLKKF